MFIYPNYGVGHGVFEEEELADNAYVILCKRGKGDEEDHMLFEWKGYNFENESASKPAEKVAGTIEEFKKGVFKEYWGEEYMDIDILE